MHVVVVRGNASRHQGQAKMTHRQPQCAPKPGALVGEPSAQGPYEQNGKRAQQDAGKAQAPNGGSPEAQTAGEGPEEQRRFVQPHPVARPVLMVQLLAGVGQQPRLQRVFDQGFRHRGVVLLVPQIGKIFERRTPSPQNKCEEEERDSLNPRGAPIRQTHGTRTRGKRHVTQGGVRTVAAGRGWWGGAAGIPGRPERPKPRGARPRAGPPCIEPRANRGK